MSENNETAQNAEGDKKKSVDSRREASWPSVLFFIHLNILGLYGIVVLFTHTKLITIVFCKFYLVGSKIRRFKDFSVNQSLILTILPSAIILTLMGIYGTTVGAHRLWAHQTFKANKFLRFWLMISQTMAGQVSRRKVLVIQWRNANREVEPWHREFNYNKLFTSFKKWTKIILYPFQGSIYDWVRVHRLHHQTFKKPDDPFYSDKDFLHAQVFSHIRKLSPHQEKLLETINMKDIEVDGIVMFQKRFYWLLYLVLFVLLPINAPLEYWDDSVQAAIFVAFSLRYIIVINIAWLINSAHFIWGLDKNHKQSDSNMVFIVTKRLKSISEFSINFE